MLVTISTSEEKTREKRTRQFISRPPMMSRSLPSGASNREHRYSCDVRKLDIPSTCDEHDRTMPELLESELTDLRAEMTLLSSDYGVSNDSNLPEFLAEHPDLFALLHQTRQKIREYFGSDAKAQLDLTSDPDGMGFVLSRN